jgi:hypothetical protein
LFLKKKAINRVALLIWLCTCIALWWFVYTKVTRQSWRFFPPVINRPMGHITHLRNLGPYKNIFPISNMHFISIYPIPPSGAMILTNLPS